MPRHFTHPLEEVINRIFCAREECGEPDLNLTCVAMGLGACSHPKRGWNAYTTVAEDVLGVMTKQGKLIRDNSTAQSKRVRDGGYYWRRPFPCAPVPARMHRPRPAGTSPTQPTDMIEWTSRP